LSRQITTDQHAALSAALSHLDAFCAAHGLSAPDLVKFWLRTFAGPPRVGLFAVAGADAAGLLRALSGAAAGADLSDWICEAGPSYAERGLLFSDGSAAAAQGGGAAAPAAAPPAVLTVRGVQLGGALISVAPYGVVRKNPAALTPEAWLERIALPVVVTPAAAAAGQLEAELARLLSKEGREFAVIVTGVGAGDQAERDSFVREIEEFKFRPLRREVGDFVTLFDESPTGTRQTLGDWVARNGATEKAAQLVRAVTPWLSRVADEIDGRVESERWQSERLDFLLAHAREQFGYLSDLVPHEGLALQNRLYGELAELSRECGHAASLFARWVRMPAGDRRGALAGLWSAWGGFASRLGSTSADLLAAVNAKHEELSQEFARAYAEHLGVLQFKPLATSFERYNQQVGSDLRQADAEFRRPVERLARRYVSLFHPEQGAGDDRHAPPEERDEQRGALRNTAERAAVRLDPNRIEREMRDELLAVVERVATPTLRRASDLLSREVIQPLRAAHAEALEEFMREVGERVAAAKQRHSWAQRRAEFNKLRERWEAVALPLARGRR
jgi:hypothetical protein